MALTNNLRINISSTLTDIVGIASVSASVLKSISSQLTDAATSIFTADGTAPATPFLTVYDLADESITDPLSTAVSFEQLELIFFYNKSENDITLGGGADDIAVLADGIIVPTGGIILLTGTYSIGVGADQITVTGTAEGDDYELIIIGGDIPV